MGATFHYLAVDDEIGEATAWFSALSDTPEVNVTPFGAMLHFRTAGELSYVNGKIDAKRLPLVSVYQPRQRRGVLWTVGEVHFLPVNSRVLFPKLEAVRLRFRNWLSERKLVFSCRGSKVDTWNYWLEGTIRNRCTELYAFPRAFEALQRGQYFVAEDDTDFVIDKLARSLRLRGIAVGDSD